MKKEETIIQDEIIDYLDTHKIPHWRISGASNMSGFPDILVCFRGRFVAFEVKTAKGTPTVQQERVMRKIEDEGGVAIIVRSLGDVKIALDKITLSLGTFTCPNTNNLSLQVLDL